MIYEPFSNTAIKQRLNHHHSGFEEFQQCYAGYYIHKKLKGRKLNMKKQTQKIILKNKKIDHKIKYKMQMSQSQPKPYFDSIEEADEFQSSNLEEYIKEYEDQGNPPKSRMRTQFPRKKEKSKQQIRRKTSKTNCFEGLLSTTLPVKLPYRPPTFFFSQNLRQHANQMMNIDIRRPFIKVQKTEKQLWEKGVSFSNSSKIKIKAKSKSMLIREKGERKYSEFKQKLEDHFEKPSPLIEKLMQQNDFAKKAQTSGIKIKT